MFEEIIEVEYLGEVEAYDLEVDHPEHTFYANDISVSNSHSISYAMISYQCAWLYTYYPIEWCAAFLNKNLEKKEKEMIAISLVRKAGFEIAPADINKSIDKWIPKDDGKTLLQPLTSIKGVGEKALDEIMLYRPFNSIEELMFNKDMKYGKVNKRVIGSLIKAQALDSIMGNGFKNLHHLWLTCVPDRPKTLKKFQKNLEEHKDCQSFEQQEMINFQFELTGLYPIERVMDYYIMEKLKELCVPPISEYEPELNVVWFVPVIVEEKLTVRKNKYFILTVIDINGILTKIKVWGVRNNDQVFINRAYMTEVDWSDQYGFSIKTTRKMKILG